MKAAAELRYLERQVEDLHYQIEQRIKRMLKLHDEAHPNENSLIRTISHTKIEFLAHSPEHRRIMGGRV